MANAAATVVATETTAPAVAEVAVKTPSKRDIFRAQKIMVLTTVNPKKVGSMSHERFQAYFGLKNDGSETVADAMKAGVRMDDIQHDSKHGFIAIGDQIEAAKKAVEAAKAKAIEDAKALLASVAK